MIDPEDLLSELDRLGTEPCWCGTWDEGGCPSCNLTMSVRRKVEALCREVEYLRWENERLRQKLQQGPKCANCCGYGTVEKPWGTHAPCEACNGKGF